MPGKLQLAAAARQVDRSILYFRIYSERNKISKHRWEKELSHIPRLIDNYVIAEGLRRGIFKQRQIDEAKALAQKNPHPFWSADTIPTLEVIA